MMTELEVIRFIGSKLFSDLIAKAVSDGVDTLRDAIKIADRNRKSETQNLQTKIYQVIIDALNQFTYNRYWGEDRLYDTAESMVKEFINGNYHKGAVKTGLKMMDSSINDAGCCYFLEILCNEICKDENSVLYKEIDMLWKRQESEYVHGAFEASSLNHVKTHEKLDSILEKLDRREEHNTADYGEIPAENRAQVYKDKWDKHVFLNQFGGEGENAPGNVNIRLKDIYLESLLPHYTWKEQDRVKCNLKERLEDYIVAIDKKRMLLILGQAGIGKSTLITWIMANLAAGKDQVLVYQFASDLENVNWQSSHLLSEILGALKLDYRELENKAFILDGFDEMRIDGDRERVLNKLDQELKTRIALKNFSFFITCRENYIYDLQKIKCDYITLQPWEDEQIETFCKGYWKKCGQPIARDKIQKIQENKEIFGIPLILYMILALDVAIEKSSSVVDVYDQIFSLKKGGIYDRCYDTEHRTNEPKVKKYIHQVTQRISFWIFENNDDKAFIYQKNFREICDGVRLEAEDDSENIQSNTLIGSYFKIKHCEGKLENEVTFVHRSIYEYFVAVYFFESLVDLQSKEEAAGKLGELLKYGRLSVQMLQFIKCKFDSMQGYEVPALIKDIFNIMLRDGMTYHTDTTKSGAACRTDEAYKNIVEREMNIFANMLEVVHLWNPMMGEADGNIVSYLQHNNLPMLNLEGIELILANLCDVNLKQTNFSHSNLNGTVLTAANLKKADFSFSNLVSINLCEAELRFADFSHAKLAAAVFSRANIEYADISNADLRRSILAGADLKRADLDGADLRHADLSEVYLESAILCGAKLGDADLSDAYLGGTDLHGAELEGTDLEAPNFSGADLAGTIFDEKQVDMLHEQYDLSRSYVYLSATGSIISYPEYCNANKAES